MTPDCRPLAAVRQAIDAVDDELLGALARRFSLAAEEQAIRAAEGLPARDPVREEETVKRALAATDPAERDTVFGIYERIFSGARGTIETIARGVCIREGKILLCQGKGATCTYLPGGHIEFGETAREALVREMREETGLETVAGGFLGVVENTFLQHGKRHCEINLVYRLDLADPTADVAAQEDWIGFRWCPVGELDAANLLPAEMKELVKPKENLS